MTSTSISIRGDKPYVQQLKALAAIKKTTLADLTRRALDAMYGEELQAIADFSFAEGFASKQSSLPELEGAPQ